MPIIAAYAVPHPPILLPEIGRGEEVKVAKTAESYAEVARRIAAAKPDVLIVVSPHATLYGDYFHLSPGTGANGSLAAFQAPDIALQVEYDAELVKRIEKCARMWDIPAGTMGEREPKLDHGALIPLWYARHAGVTCKVVRIGLSGLPALSHYRLGQCIAEAADALNRRAILVASGDLSHKLTADGPYGYAKEGALLDAQLTASLASGDFQSLLTISPELAGAAAECGLRSFQIMAGALDQKAVTHTLLSYEGPFGVGYAVAAFEVRGTDTDRAFGKLIERTRLDGLRRTKAQEDAYVRLARLSLETLIRTGSSPKIPANLPPELMHIRAGVFVSLKKDGQLRGCIGTTAATTECVATEIMRNAVAAATHDPRFEPVREEELDDLVYSVDVLGAPESIAAPDQLDPKRYGVIVQNGSRRGLLLPDLDGVDTVAQQLEIARRKAGLQDSEPVRLFRFEVVRHH